RAQSFCVERLRWPRSGCRRDGREDLDANAIEIAGPCAATRIVSVLMAATRRARGRGQVNRPQVQPPRSAMGAPIVELRQFRFEDARRSSMLLSSGSRRNAA